MMTAFVVWINDVIKLNEHMPIFKTEDDRHTHRLGDRPALRSLPNCKLCSATVRRTLHPADGHHRSASSVNVALERRKEFPDAPKDAEFNYFHGGHLSR